MFVCVGCTFIHWLKTHVPPLLLWQQQHGCCFSPRLHMQYSGILTVCVKHTLCNSSSFFFFFHVQTKCSTPAIFRHRQSIILCLSEEVQLIMRHQRDRRNDESGGWRLLLCQMAWRLRRRMMQKIIWSFASFCVLCLCHLSCV